MSSGVNRRTALKLLLGGGATGLAGVGGYGFLYERHELTVTRANLPVIDLPQPLEGVRIGLLTDTHRSRWVSHADVVSAVTALMNEKPDLIVLGGDYVTWGGRGPWGQRQYVHSAADALDALTAPLGVYGILGNHDDDHDMPAALTVRGVQMLKDARTTITIRGRAVDLVGIRFWTRRAADIASLMKGASGTVVLLAHDPRRLNEAAGLKIPLMLSGHTHGGQVVVPGVGPVAAQKFPVVSGIGRRDRTTIFVSKGVGTVYVPVRVNCPPEVAVLTLQRDIQEAARRISG
jgi:uncharacterized protein